MSLQQTLLVTESHLHGNGVFRLTNGNVPFVPGLEYLSAARSLHPELHAGSTLASQDFQLSLEGKEFL